MAVVWIHYTIQWSLLMWGYRNKDACIIHYYPHTQLRSQSTPKSKYIQIIRRLFVGPSVSVFHITQIPLYIFKTRWYSFYKICREGYMNQINRMHQSLLMRCFQMATITGQEQPRVRAVKILSYT